MNYTVVSNLILDNGKDILDKVNIWIPIFISTISCFISYKTLLAMGKIEGSANKIENKMTKKVSTFEELLKEMKKIIETTGARIELRHSNSDYELYGYNYTEAGRKTFHIGNSKNPQEIWDVIEKISKLKNKDIN